MTMTAIGWAGLTAALGLAAALAGRLRRFPEGAKGEIVRMLTSAGPLTSREVQARLLAGGVIAPRHRGVPFFRAMADLEDAGRVAHRDEFRRIGGERIRVRIYRSAGR
jgi:hypothetical protein